MAFKVIVVIETDQLGELAQAAMAELGNKLRNERAVRQHSKRFARRIASDTSPLRVEVLDVVGYCNPFTERPNLFEPIVIYEGKPVPVSTVVDADGGDYWVCTAADFGNSRDKIVAELAHRVACDLAFSEAIAQAIHDADEDCVLSGFAIDVRASAVELHGDDDGVIAKRLPKWIKMEPADEQ